MAGPSSFPFTSLTPAAYLEDALGALRKVWKGEGRKTLSRRAIAQALGYSSAHGSAQGIISAMRKFDLLERTGRELAITSRAKVLADHDPRSPEYVKALQEAANSPKLFSDLFGWLKGGVLPSEAELQHELRDRGFTNAGAYRACRAFLETARFAMEANLAARAEQPPTEQSAETDFLPNLPVIALDATNVRADPKRAQEIRRRWLAPFREMERRRRAVFPLSSGEAVVEWPAKLSPSEYDDLKKWLGLVERQIKRSVAEPAGEETKGELEPSDDD